MTKYMFAKASLSVITLVSGLILHAQFPSATLNPTPSAAISGRSGYSDWRAVRGSTREARCAGR